MSDDEVLRLIQEALRSTLPERESEFGQVTLDTDLQSLGIGSLAFMETVGYLEDHLATTFRGADMAKASKVRDIATLVRATGITV
ncbi:acyl carrier protein [Myxococcaceae bacterium JPH2]|nr:acyl carrier protein [Myxococcaceae bacterium JPH2]